MPSSRRVLLLAGLALPALGCAAVLGDDTGDLHVPPGFAIEVFAKDLPGVRSLELGPDGLLYAALSGDGKIVRIDVTKPGGVPETVAAGLNQPFGMAFHDGALYVGDTDQVIRLEGPDFKRKT